MKHPASQALFAAWDLWRDGGAIPDPASVSPVDLGPLLSDLVLIDLRAPEFRIRYSGTAVATRYGHDLQGESFMSIWNAEDAETVARLIGGMKTRRTGLVAGFLGETSGGGCTAFEMVLLPLGSDNTCISAVGVIVRTGGHDDHNRLRARLLSQSLVSARIMAKGARSSRPPLPVPPEMLRKGGGIRGRYGHLTLVEGGR